MTRKSLRTMSAAFQVGYAEGNNWRANVWPFVPSVDVGKVASNGAVAEGFDSPESRLDYRAGFLRACGLVSHG